MHCGAEVTESSTNKQHHLSSWADVVPQRKSSLNYLIFCNNAVFSWKSSLSSVLAMSSAEAQLLALCACAADVAYYRKLAK
jgi:hypothetical protein